MSLLWRLAVILDVWGWVRYWYGCMVSATETIESVKEGMETVLELHESGRLECLYFGIGVFVLAFSWPCGSGSSGRVRASGSCSTFSSSVAPSAPPGLSVSSVAATSGSKDEDYDRMMKEFLRRIDSHARVAEEDAAAGSVTSPRASAPGPPRAPEAVQELVSSLEGNFRNFREVAVEKLRAFREDENWQLAGTRSRAEPAMIARISRAGRSCEQYVRDLIQAKGLDGN